MSDKPDELGEELNDPIVVPAEIDHDENPDAHVGDPTTPDHDVDVENLPDEDDDAADDEEGFA